MSDKPILFSAPMVRALLAGTKTQTRRHLTAWCDEPPAIVLDGVIISFDDRERPHRWPRTHAVGDRLYVREHWRTGGQHDHLAPRDLSPEWAHPIEYFADQKDIRNGRFRQAMHMPRWASRITLTVTDVRVERLQDISEEDARGEGVAGNSGGSWGCEGLIEDYADLWDSINGTGSWDANPFVAAYTFTVEHCNIDQARAA